MILFIKLLWAEPSIDEGIENDTTVSESSDTTPEEEEQSSQLVKMPELVEYVQVPYPTKAKEEGREGDGQGLRAEPAEAREPQAKDAEARRPYEDGAATCFGKCRKLVAP